MAPILMSFRASRPYSVVNKVVPAVRRPGIGFVLAVLLSMFLALAAQAQTDSGSSSSTVPTLTIVSSSATATEGDEVTYTVTASSAPTAALPVVVHVRAHGEVMDTRTVAEVLLPAGATTVTLRLEEFTDEIDESPVNVTLTLAAGTGYSVGDPAEATVSIDYPSNSDAQATPTPTPTPAVSPPDAPSGVSISAPSINSFTVSWTAEAGKTYRVEREAAFLFKYRVWQIVADDLATGSYTENGLPCGLYYLFQVRAKVTGSAYGDGTKKLGHSQSCPSTTSAGSRNTRDHVDPPKLRVVTDNPTEDKIQIRLLLFGPTGNEEQYTSIPASLGLTDFQVDRSKRVVGSNPKEWPDSGTDLNTNYRKTRQVAEFDWTGLECGASYHFRARSGKRTVSSNQSTVVWGHWSDDASATPMNVLLSMSVHGSTRGCPQLAVPDVTIIPLPKRKAMLSWGDISDAKRYVVQAIKFTGSETISSVSTPSPLSNATDTSYRIEQFDNILGGEGLAHLNAGEGFKFRITVEFNDTSKASQHSEVILVAGPTVTVNGDSSTNTDGQMVVSWTPVSGTTGYTVRWRKVSNSHGDRGWQVTEAGDKMDWKVIDGLNPSTMTVNGVDVKQYTIVHTSTNPLQIGQLYAIQLNYTDGSNDYFSAREAYAWLSTEKPGTHGGLTDRVATYPFSGHYPSKIYTYRICRKTLPGWVDLSLPPAPVPPAPANSDKVNNWALLLQGALERWEEATNGFITMTPDYDDTVPGHDPNVSPVYEPCTDYSGTNSGTSQALFEDNTFRRLMSEDNGLSEILMITPPNSSDLVNSSIDEFILVADPGKHCLTIVTDYYACASTSPSYEQLLQPIIGANVVSQAITDYGTFVNAVTGRIYVTSSLESRASSPLRSSDIVFNFEKFKSVDPNRPDRVVLGVCIDGTTPKPVDSTDSSHFVAYSIAVHEAGHALGLSTRSLFEIGKNGPYYSAHPSTADAVMNYDGKTPGLPSSFSEPDCTPHPLDVLAIHALYQSPARP